MADYITPTTELEAVNAMLHSIGESPVVTIDDSTDPLPVDVDIAVRVLRSVNREVQVRGWTFNTECRYPLTRDVSGFIPLPANAMHVDPDGDYRLRDGVMRGNRLYDKDGHSFVWNSDLTATIKFLLPMEDLPEAARNYIAIRATRRFQAGSVGSASLNSFTETDEVSAKVLMEHDESDAGDYNMHRDTADHASAYIYRGGGYGPY